MYQREANARRNEHRKMIDIEISCYLLFSHNPSSRKDIDTSGDSEYIDVHASNNVFVISSC